ncbi:hypothetical protein SAMN04489761_0568 [Tenacibaculum sp. MAR_2009_124]|uniref:hypothetical protein n=1 Tax=Tenacibaculum sp. MAR_2009_124 TaxID=1250059 RepID=UPI00089DA642|nr:hypothetical protein [Tenacibaculum sp. MAR_2009_124]SEB41483.1 hypothetical protein SAMN04489761_0568 [Tenacibaculum sp. MAR_2009_124]
MITTQHLQSNTRLKNLETEMKAIIESSNTKLSLESLKGNFYKRASLQTVKGILKASNVIGISSRNNVGITVEVKYNISGVDLDTIYIGGEGSTTTSGILSNVSMNPDNTIDLEVNQNTQTNNPYNFNTDYIRNSSQEYNHTNNPINDSDEYVLIETEPV